MRSIRDVRGLGTPKRGAHSEGIQAKVFRAGQSPTWTRAGFMLIAVAISVWLLLLIVNTALALIWTGVCLLGIVLWAAVYWTAGDSDTPQAQRAQSTPGFDQGPINRQVHDVIHEHDHH